jgi:predicted metal-dependent peptidase
MAYSKLQGKTPDGIESRLEALLASKVDWRELLSAYISKQMPYDYSFARPSKRSASVGVYLPSVTRESLEVVVAIDTSGSIGKEEMQRFASEMLGIATSFHGVKISLVQADCKVHSDIEISSDYEDVVKNIVVIGGGGTSHVPVFEHIAKEHPDARVAVCFTDGFTDYPDRAPEIDTIWAMTTKLTAPFGKTVRVEIEKVD